MSLIGVLEELIVLGFPVRILLDGIIFLATGNE
jgi:hypothetical protein